MINDSMIWSFLGKYALTSMLAVVVIILGWRFFVGLVTTTVSPLPIPTCTLDTLKIGDQMELRGYNYVISKINSYGHSGAIINLETND